MTKKDVQNLAREYMIFEDEIDNTIRFVHDLLVLQTEEIAQREPYATTTIKELKNASHYVWNLEDYLDEVWEE